MDYLKSISAEQKAAFLAPREGESKLGETIHYLSVRNWRNELTDCPAPFVLLGIPEDIGVRANLGMGGSHTLWNTALKAILNVQATDTLSGDSLALLGAFDFSSLMTQTEGRSAKELREVVNIVDEAVFPVIQSLVSAGKIPIVVGGGHNNAYPILKGASRALSSPLNCINLDAHSDYRRVEGRHSGNGFRYAKMDGYLKKYAVLGLHRNYNSQSIIQEMGSDPDIWFRFYEDVFLDEKYCFNASLDEAQKFVAGSPTGIEIDLDAIERTLASARTPCGVSSLQARRYIYKMARYADAAYLHIAEGSTQLANGSTDSLTGKLVSYLVTDFVRVFTTKQTIFIRQADL